MTWVSGWLDMQILLKTMIALGGLWVSSVTLAQSGSPYPTEEPSQSETVAQEAAESQGADAQTTAPPEDAPNDVIDEAVPDRSPDLNSRDGSFKPSEEIIEDEAVSFPVNI